VPWVSDRQRRWGHTASGLKALGAAKVAEYDAATKEQGMKRKVSSAAKKIAAARSGAGEPRAMSRSRRKVARRPRGRVQAARAGRGGY
jgi:hypothetical protein